MKDREPQRPIEDAIMEVWDGYDDLERGGIEFVVHLLRSDIRSIEEDIDDHDEVVEELCDIAMNSIRALEEFTDEGADELIRQRLTDRIAGNQDELYEKYWEDFQ